MRSDTAQALKKRPPIRGCMEMSNRRIFRIVALALVGYYWVQAIVIGPDGDDEKGGLVDFHSCRTGI